MSFRSAIERHLAVDYIREQLAAEGEIYERHGITHDFPLPLDGDTTLAAEVYKLRLKTTVQYPGKVLLRAVGLDKPTEE